MLIAWKLWRKVIKTLIQFEISNDTFLYQSFYMFVSILRAPLKLQLIIDQYNNNETLEIANVKPPTYHWPSVNCGRPNRIMISIAIFNFVNDSFSFLFASIHSFARQWSLLCGVPCTDIISPKKFCGATGPGNTNMVAMVIIRKVLSNHVIVTSRIAAGDVIMTLKTSRAFTRRTVGLLAKELAPLDNIWHKYTTPISNVWASHCLYFLCS